VSGYKPPKSPDRRARSCGCSQNKGKYAQLLLGLTQGGRKGCIHFITAVILYQINQDFCFPGKSQLELQSFIFQFQWISNKIFRAGEDQDFRGLFRDEISFPNSTTSSKGLWWQKRSNQTHNEALPGPIQGDEKPTG